MSQIKLTADSGGGTTSLKAPSSTTSNADVVLKLPVADGSSGQVLKTDGSGQLSFTSNAGTTINNNANNRVITGSGTANTLEGESTFTYDGSGNVGITNSSGAVALTVTTANNTDGGIYFTDGSDGNKGAVSYLHTDDSMKFRANGTTKMTLDSSGRLLIGTTTEGQGDADDLTIATSGRTGMTIRSADDEYGNIFFSDATSGTDEYVGKVQYYHGDNSMRLATNSTDRLIINSSGDVGIGTGAPAKNLHIYDSGVADFRLETGAANGQAWDFLSTYGGSANTGTLSIRNESGSSFLDLQENGGSPRTTISNGGSVQFQFDADGVKFNGDTAAANALDDYEEGTWTPQIGGSNVSVNHAEYTKVGNLVHIDFDLTNDTGGAGNAITGLPFTATDYSGFSFDWVSNTSGGTQNAADVQGGYVTQAKLSIREAGGNASANINNGQRVLGHGTYRT